MAPRAQPHQISWPLSPNQVDDINDMFRILFQDLTITDASIGASSGVLAVASGGTGLSSYTIGDLLYASASTTLSKLVDVAAGSYLRSGGAGAAPLWSTLTLPNAATKGDLMVATANNAIGSLADAATGNVLRSGGVGSLPAYGKVDLATDVTGAIGPTSGGTGQTTVAIGDLLYGSAVNTWAKLGIGGVNRILLAGGIGSPPSWSSIAFAANAASAGAIVVVDSSSSVVLSGILNAVAKGSLLVSDGTLTPPVYSTAPRASASIGVQNFTNNQAAAIKFLTELTTIAAAATTDTTIQFPANCLALGASVRVTTAIPTAATFDVGDAGTPTLFNTGLSVALNTTGKNAPSAYTRYTAATSVRITPNLTPANNNGRVRVTIYYIEFTVPDS